MVSVVLMADLFGKKPVQMASDVVDMPMRREQDEQEKGGV